MEIKEGGIVSRLLAQVPIPKMFRAEQVFPRESIAPGDIPSVVKRELSKKPFCSKIRPGMEIAVTVGSRGIANVDVITKAIVDFIQEQGATPFLVPAMGSHGGATAEGQLEVLASYHITPESMGCEIRSSMEVVDLGVSDTGQPVLIDKYAYDSDGIIVSCRLKPHNAFRARYESGPCKMMAVGLGKQRGAEQVHRDGMGRIGLCPADAGAVPAAGYPGGRGLYGPDRLHYGPYFPPLRSERQELYSHAGGHRLRCSRYYGLPDH